MIVLLIFSILAILLTYFEGNNKLKGGMNIGFAIVILVACIRDNYGNDWPNYLDWYTQISRSKLGLLELLSSKAIFGVDNGWSILNYFFIPFGFNTFVAAITIFTGVVYYHFIKENVERKWWWLAVFVYLFSSQIFVLGLSMLRQTFAITLFVWSYKYVKKNEIVRPFLMMLAACLVHSSAIITIPFLFLNRLKFENNKLFACILVAIYLGLNVVARFTSDILNQMALFSTFERYADTYTNVVKEYTLGIGYIVMQLPFFLYVVHVWRNKVDGNIGAALLMSSIPFFLLAFKDVSMSERLGYYFAGYSIICIPLVISSFKNKLLRLSFLAVYIVVTLYCYNMFFTSEIWRDAFFKYRTIFG